MRRIVLSTICLTLLSAGFASAQVKEPIQPADVYVRSARIALATKPPEYQRALKNLYLARQHYPDNFQVHFLLGSIWADKDEIDSMVVEYALAEQYATPKEWGKTAKNLEKVIEAKWFGQFDRAVKMVNLADSTEEAAAAHPDPAIADSLSFRVKEMRRIAKEALRHCGLLNPKDFRAYSTRGLVYQREGILDSSLADFAMAESLFHRNELQDSTTNWYDTTAFFSGPDGEPTELYKQYEKKLKKLSEEKQTRYRNMMLSLVSAYYDSQMWPETIFMTRRFYGLEPNHVNSIVTLADVFSRLEMEDEAFKWQEAVVRRNPESKDTWYNMGIFYYNTAVRLQDSVGRYEGEVSSDPKNETAAALLRDFTKNRLENFAKAVPRFRKVVEIDPNDSDTWRLLAICLYSLASHADDLQVAGNQTLADEVFKEIFAVDRFDRDAAWTDAEEILAKANDQYPDDRNLCYMMKVTLAQLRKMDALEQWKPRCP